MATSFKFLLLMSVAFIAKCDGKFRSFEDHSVETIFRAQPESQSTDINAPNVTKVHVVFMNHLDVGYSILKGAGIGFVDSVLNRYFTRFFPHAARLAEELRLLGWSERFIYTTHPWLVSMYVDCPPDLVLSGVKLKCPSQKDLNLFTRAVARGDITWHAGPMNMQVENADQTMFEFGLSLSDELDKRFNITRKNKVLSQRDVPGLTHAAIPSLVSHGIVGVSVGVNPMTSPPAVPSVFRWQYGSDEVLATWHPGGYPLNPGIGPKHPGGLSRKDCHTVDGFSEALCFAFRTDNSGPPISVLEVRKDFNIVKSQFPGATVQASTFEAFFEALMPIRNQLPVVTKEFGDTWIQGISSDPGKMAKYRAVMRVFADCVKMGDCQYTDRRFFNASRFLLKMGEHTYGISNLYDTVNWTNAQFQQARTDDNYMHELNSWIEQRNFSDLAMDALEDHTVRKKAQEELEKLTVSGNQPDLTGYSSVPISTNVYQCAGGIEIGFSNSGAINHLKYNGVDENTLNGLHSGEHCYVTHTNWTNGGQELGLFEYISYNESDFDAFGDLYNYNGHSAGYIKVNLTKAAHPISKTWTTTLKDMYQHSDKSCDFYMHSIIDPVAVETYGAPQNVWTHFAVRTTSPGVNISVALYNKTTTRLPEALMVTFDTPTQANHKWLLNKLGRVVNPTNVVLNGSQHQHAIDMGVYYVEEQSMAGLQIQAPDTPVVCVATKGVPRTVFPAPLSPITDEITAVSFNIFNNIWDTNYIYWYPYLNEDKNLLARFSLDFIKKGKQVNQDRKK